MEWVGPSRILSDLAINKGASLTNRAGGTVIVENNIALRSDQPLGGRFHNQGTLDLLDGVQLSVQVELENDGTLTVPADSRLELAGPFSNLADDTLTGGTYHIAGEVFLAEGDIVTNAATLILDGPAAQVRNLQSDRDAISG